MAGKIVIGFEGSDAGEDALTLGALVARATGDEPIVATVYPEEHAIGIGRVDAEWVAYLREQAEEVSRRARRVLGDELTADYRIVGSSSAAHGLDDLGDAEEATMIVVGADRRSPRRRILAGSTGQRLLQGAGRPVAVAPRGLHEQSWGTLRTIGCAFVDTPDGHEALKGATALAQRIPARLKAFTATGPQPDEIFSPFAGRDAERAVRERTRGPAQEALDAALAALPSGVEASGELLDGNPVDALAALDDRDVDLLVCGSRGYGPVRRVLLGGVSGRLVRHASCPIVIVPREGGEMLRGRGAAGEAAGTAGAGETFAAPS